MKLKVNKFSFNQYDIFYRENTKKLSLETKDKIIQENNITIVVDTTINPDRTWRIDFFAKYIPDSKNANIKDIDFVASFIAKKMIEGEIPLVVSYFGINRSPVIAILALCELGFDLEEIYQGFLRQNSKILSMNAWSQADFWKSLLGVSP